MSQDTVVAATEQPEVTKSYQIIEEGEAWLYFREVRRHLRSDLVGMLVKTRGDKPLSLEELKFLVRPETNDDEEESERSEVCTMCNGDFTPVRWLDITSQRFLELVGQGASLREAAVTANVLVFGKYYLNPEMKNGYGAFCGHPYVFNKVTQQYVVNPTSCIGRMKLAHPDRHWGISLAGVEEEFRLIEEERLEQERREAEAAREAERRTQLAQNFFAQKTGSAKPNDGYAEPNRRAKRTKERE